MKTLALNMIVGPGDADVFRRCLQSFNYKKYCNELIIGITTDDPEVQKAAEELADRGVKFAWSTEEHPYGDFAGARNAVLYMTSSDYVLWLDADDILTAENIDNALTQVRKVLDTNDFDFFLCPYILNVDANGDAADMINRERIFRRTAGIRWDRVIHEQLTIDESIHKRATLKGLDVLHMPMKDSRQSVGRNLAILQHAYLSNPADRHYAYYYARDLVQSGNWKAAVPIFVNLINTFNGDLKNLYETALQLSRYYAYKMVIRTGELTELNPETSSLAERYVRISKAVTSLNAEPFVVHGDICYCQDRIDEAISIYKEAMSKHLETGYLQQKQYYEELPARRLADIFLKTNELEQALWFNKIALKHCPSDTSLASQRRTIIKELV